jgi:hypothetical protein
MSTVGSVNDREDRPAYIRFEIVPIEDKAASLATGHYVAKDIEYALITPPYSKDVFKIKVPQWKLNMQQDVSNGRLPEQWMHGYLKAYEMWKKGQEMPLNGTAIKGWGVISPAQQETLIRMSILTVEDLAAVNDEGLRRIGMGAGDLKNKAKGWLSQLQDKGPLTQEIASVRNENAILKGAVASLEIQVKALMESSQNAQPYAAKVEAGITAGDILEDDAPAINANLHAQYENKFGKPPHHRMKEETIREALAG